MSTDGLGYIASLIMGIILGLVGGGGSILTVPIMIYLFGISPTLAIGNSLFVVGATALVGGILYIRRGEVDLKSGFYFALPSVIGVSTSRAVIVPALPDSIFVSDNFAITKEILILVSFAILMIFASYSMIRNSKSESNPRVRPTNRFQSLIFQGLIVGLIAGFVGAGGGFLIIPALVLLAGLTMRVAIGTSLIVIAIQSLLGFATDFLRGLRFEWSFLILVASIATVGIVVGSAFAHKVSEQKLKTSFGWFVLIIGTAILAEQLGRLQN